MIFSKPAYRNIILIIIKVLWVFYPTVMSETNRHTFADEHNFRTTLAAAALFVIGTLALVAAAAATTTAAIVAVTALAVLGCQHALAVLRTSRRNTRSRQQGASRTRQLETAD